MRFSRSVAAACFATSVFSLLSSTLTGCGSEGNDGKISAALPPVMDEAGLPINLRIAGGIPDLPPDQVVTNAGDCERSKQYEYADGWFRTFEAVVPAPLGYGLAYAWGAFDDLTQGAFVVPRDFSAYPGLFGATATKTITAIEGGTWGLPAELFAGPKCGIDLNRDGQDDPEPNEWVLHVKGGPFKDFGGGAGHGIGAQFIGTTSCDGKDYCPPPGVMTPDDPNGVDAPGGPAGPPYLNLEEYEGISFWARKGPEGQPTMLVSFTDKFTSDDLNKGNQKYCRRLKQCQLTCRNGKPCTESTVDPTLPSPNPGEEDVKVFRCFHPDELEEVGRMTGTTREALFPRCGEKSACTFNETLADPDFEYTTTGATCQNWSFSGDEGGQFCVPPGEEPPQRYERCGDGWAAGIHLTDEWKFFTIPFSELRQGWYGKVGPYLDLKTLFSVTLGWGAGWVDFYVDNISFYRKKRSNSPEAGDPATGSEGNP